MKKDKQEKCSCGCGCDESCNCMENECSCGCMEGHCDCECECNCGCDELNVVDEQYVLIGKKDDKKTEDAVKLLDKEGVKYEFMDLDNAPLEFKDVAKDMKDKLDVPSVMVFQLVEAGIISGLDGIKKYFK